MALSSINSIRCIIASISRRRTKSTSVLVDSSSRRYKNHDIIQPPTSDQLRLIFLNTTIPMIGFGFMDQTIMLQAGNAIDCTLGVMFGISTLTAAAFGQICSDGAGVLFGRSLEQLVSSMGVPKSGITTAQRSLVIVKKTKLAGSFIGVVLGCTLGLVNLLFITDNTTTTATTNGCPPIIQLESCTTGDKKESAFPKLSVEAYNSDENFSVLRVCGPADVDDGLLTTMTTVLSSSDCSVIELHHAKCSSNNNKDDDNTIIMEDVFHVVKRSTRKAFAVDELEELAKKLLNSTTRTITNETNH